MELFLFKANYNKRGFSKLKRFEMPITYEKMRRALDPEGKGEEELEQWRLIDIAGPQPLIEACFKNKQGEIFLDLQSEIDFTASIFEEWSEEFKLNLLAQAAQKLKRDFRDFVWSGWHSIIYKEDGFDFEDTLRMLNWGGEFVYAGQKPSAEEITAYLKKSPHQFVLIEDYYILLT